MAAVPFQFRQTALPPQISARNFLERASSNSSQLHSVLLRRRRREGHRFDSRKVSRLKNKLVTVKQKKLIAMFSHQSKSEQRQNESYLEQISSERSKSEFFIDSILHRRHQESQRPGKNQQLWLERLLAEQDDPGLIPAL